MIRGINDMTNVIAEWVHCPVCGNKTRLQIRKNTELKNNNNRGQTFNKLQYKKIRKAE